MKVILIAILSIFILSSCTKNADKNAATNKEPSIDAIESSNVTEKENYDAIFSSIPDTLTVEQKDLQHKLLTLMKENVKIKDGIIYSAATKEDFVNQDVPLYYYDMLNENIKDLNRGIEVEGLDPQKFYDEIMKDFPEI